MRNRINSDNIYAEGSLITAKNNPSLRLKIITYNQRIYYCAAVGDEGGKQLAYYERELILPAKPGEINFQLTIKP